MLVQWLQYWSSEVTLKRKKDAWSVPFKGVKCEDFCLKCNKLVVCRVQECVDMAYFYCPECNKVLGNSDSMSWTYSVDLS